MHRIFLGLAVTVGTLLLVSFVTGFFVPSGQGGAWHDLHFLISLFAAMATLLVHSIVYTYFLGTGKWVLEVVRVYELPDWVKATAIKNKRRAFPFVLWSMLLVGAASWLGAATDTRKAMNATWALWHLGISSLAMGFNLVAFFIEYASIVAQARLVLEVKDQADRLREARASAIAEIPDS